MFTELFDSKYGRILLHSFDTNQTNAVRSSGRSPNHADFEMARQLVSKNRVGDESLILDVGANYGFFTTIMSEDAKNAVLAFEPQPDVFHICAANMALLSRDKVRCFPFAVGETAQGIAPLTIPVINPRTRTSFGSHELSDERREYNNVSGRCPTLIISLDYAWNNLAGGRRVDMAKIDVEGMEASVLRSGAMLLSRDDAPILHLEHLKCDRRELETIMRGFGYTQFRWFQHDVIAGKAGHDIA